jgi:hypothetical protein
MATNILIQVPNSLFKYHTPLRYFFEGMIKKLEKNSHKDTPTIKSIPEIVENLREEIIEFEEQLGIDKFNQNTLIELMDAANFAFLAYIALRMQGVSHDPKDTISSSESERG